MASPLKGEDVMVPVSIHWTCDDVANWIEDIGFPQYRQCITTNLIDGRKLILLNASNIPRIGITDFDHMLFITSSVRELLGIQRVHWDRSIADSKNSALGSYLEKKSRTGQTVDTLTYSVFLRRG